jgi:predicted TIM-barrel fold metal-dependent hydrolase
VTVTATYLVRSRVFPMPSHAVTPRAMRPLEAYLALLDRLGFDRGVLVQPSAYGRDNRAMLDALTRAPTRLRGVAVGGAEFDTPTLKLWHAAGVRGLRANEFRRDGRPYYQKG